MWNKLFLSTNDSYIVLGVIELNEVPHVDLADIALVCKLQQLLDLAIINLELKIGAYDTFDIIVVYIALLPFIKQLISILSLFLTAAALAKPPANDIFSGLKVKSLVCLRKVYFMPF